MSQEQVGTRLDVNDSETLDRYCSEQDVTKAEALRHGIRELDQSGRLEWDTERIWQASVGAGLIFVVFNQAFRLPGVLAVVVGIGIATSLLLSFLDQFTG